MNILSLLPFILIIGVMFLMTRSAKKKQQQAAEMRNQMQPGTGVRTIGGMYAVVKEVSDEAVTLEVAPGVHAIYAKNSVGAVLDDDEYNRIVHGITPEDVDTPDVPDDASSLTQADEPADADVSADSPIDLGKKDAGGDAEPKKTEGEGDTK
ncbi:preprotein translocase subunit YajC [Streptomyces sp. YC504]|uniref:Preprotein translocase subunit YajC n=1 Tax=Streptomyces mesophilus TaxID=1775132 RepID=A0A6G4XBS4_9ACTN|nr:preprotein translocase subunit YajC [Streptomyces mesophilus]NGO75006.1 preprotein translocase subunit YajC [Streptomyces mesophilus]